MAPPSLRHEKNLLRRGFKTVAGVDEAGRGPLAGPVVAAAVIFPHDVKIKGLRDSKVLSPRTREKLHKEILKKAVSVGIGIVGEAAIDEINILRATFQAMRDAIEGLGTKPDHILVDGRHKIPCVPAPQLPIVGGDDISSSIAAASIVAKVTRDRMMIDLERLYPGWGFAKHKGYGTKGHFKALKEKGISPIHRMTFEPVAGMLSSRIP